MPLSKKRGRPPKYVTGRDGKPVVGLSYSRSIRQYYASHSKPRRYFGSDFDAALAKFRARQAAEDGEPYAAIKVELPLPPVQLPPEHDPDYFVEQLNAGRPFEELVEELGGRFQLLPQDAVYAWVRTELLKNPTRFAERVGIPEIGYLQDLAPPGPPLTLKQVCNLYFRKRKRISPDWERKQRGYWQEFAATVGVKTLREVTHVEIERYHDAVWDEHNNNGRSSTYVSHRLTAVRTILRHALKKGRDQQQVRRVLELTEMFEFPGKTTPKPNPISPADFQRLLEVCSPKWRAVLLRSLNCAFYPSEVAAVKREHIDFEAQTLMMDRGKTRVPRVAVLWNRTIEALREYQRSEPHQSASMFVSRSGIPFNANHMSRNFRRRRAEAELPDTVTFDSIRDGAYTAASRGGAIVDQARMLGGHRVSGVSDYYLKRNPQMVAEACAAIEKAYFD